MKVLERKPVQFDFKLPERIIDSTLSDLSNHPVVLKKTERAREFLEKHPIPEHLRK